MTGLLANCAHQPCGRCFEAAYDHQAYCCGACRDTASLIRRKARWDAGKADRKPIVHRCNACNLTFDTGNQLGGHRSAVHVRPAHMRPTKTAAQTPAPPPARPRPTGTVVTVTVHKTMTFTCADCPATYTDSNRYAHHRRELHGARRTAAVEMQVTRPLYATRIA